jgi:hypothetical protein
MIDKAIALAKMREPFLPHQISMLPKPYKKDSPKGNCKECGGYHGLPALHLDYVGHAALTDRLLDVDPEWFWEPVAFDQDGLPARDRTGGLWIRLTVAGMSRLGYGDADGKTGGNAVKEIIGDALRNAAMRFGAALDLWHKGDLHGDDEAHSAVQERDPPSVKPAPEAEWSKALAGAIDYVRRAPTRLELDNWVKSDDTVQFGKELSDGDKAAFKDEIKKRKAEINEMDQVRS